MLNRYVPMIRILREQQTYRHTDMSIRKSPHAIKTIIAGNGGGDDEDERENIVAGNGGGDDEDERENVVAGMVVVMMRTKGKTL